jgi:hypothetical protein
LKWPEAIFLRSVAISDVDDDTHVLRIMMKGSSGWGLH